jgi:hypothetical protein
VVINKNAERRVITTAPSVRGLVVNSKQGLGFPRILSAGIFPVSALGRQGKSEIRTGIPSFASQSGLFDYGEEGFEKRCLYPPRRKEQPL